jgi:hypothetical protein
MRDPATTADQKRRAKNKAQNRWRQNSKRHIEVSYVPINILVRKYVVEVIKWIDGVKDVKELDALDPRERRRLVAEAIREGLEEAAQAHFKK